jgi:DNA-binding response OmpR family regulator
VARILLAMYEGKDRGPVISALRAAGHNIFTVGDAEECLSFLLARPPEVLLLDPALPRLQTSGLLRSIRHDTKFESVFVVFLGGRTAAGYWAAVVDQLSDGVLDRSSPKAVAEGIGRILGIEPPPPAEVPVPVAPVPAVVPRKQILVVERVAHYGLMLGLEFVSRGWTATCESNATTVLETLRREPVHAVLSDLDLADGAAIALAARVRRDHPRVKMLLMTDLPRNEWPEPPDRVPILPKPISVDMLLQAMRFMKMEG